MKNTIFKITFGVFIACLLALALQSFSPSKTMEKEAEIVKVETVETDFGKAEMFFAGVGGYVRTNYRQDTITNAELDTIGLVARNSTTLANALASYTPFLSLYTLNLKINRVNATGTTSIKLYLDESATATPTAGGWVTIDSTTTTAAGVGIINRTDLLGEVYRLRVKGAGTQSTYYTITGLHKKKN
jgi:hypothetical protein